MLAVTAATFGMFHVKRSFTKVDLFHVKRVGCFTVTTEPKGAMHNGVTLSPLGESAVFTSRDG